VLARVGEVVELPLWLGLFGRLTKRMVNKKTERHLTRSFLGRNDGRRHLAIREAAHHATVVIRRQNFDRNQRQDPGPGENHRKPQQEDRRFDRKARIN